MNTALADRIRRNLIGLRMRRAMEVLDHVLQRLERGEITAIKPIDGPLAEEHESRETRRVGVALTTARLTPIRTLEGFDFAFQPSLDRDRIMALARLEFIDRAEVVHFLGPPGTGKSHLAAALGVAAVKAGRSVHGITLAGLVEALLKTEREGRLAERIRFHTRTALLIVDDIGYLPPANGGANLFFQLVNARYEKGAMILTSNCGFAEWGEIFGDPVVATALLDRLLHHAVVVRTEAQATDSGDTPTSFRSTRGRTRRSHRHRRPRRNGAGGPEGRRQPTLEPDRLRKPKVGNSAPADLGIFTSALTLLAGVGNPPQRGVDAGWPKCPCSRIRYPRADPPSGRRRRQRPAPPAGRWPGGRRAPGNACGEPRPRSPYGTGTQGDRHHPLRDQIPHPVLAAGEIPEVGE